MGVVLDIVGQSEVDDMRQIVHIQSACSDICCHKQLRQVVTELLHRQVALLLRKVAMQRLRIITVFDEFVGNLLRLNLRATEYDGEDTGIIINDAFQRQILILGVHHIIDMVHVFGPFVTAAHHDFLIVVQIFLSHALHLLAHRGREHQRVMLLGERFEDFVDTIRETHVQHLVGLVEHDVCHLFQVRKAAMHQVNESSWCSHNDLDTLLQGSHLWFDGCTTIYSLYMYAIHILGKVAQVVGNLQTEFSGGRQHQGLCLPARGVNTL